MIEEFECKGTWWLPSNPDEKIGGTLRFSSSDGAILELMGCFGSVKNIPVSLSLEIVLGNSTGSEKITLYNCFERRKNTVFGPSGLSGSSVIFAHVVFVGAHFAKKEDITFNRMSVRYSYLDNWVGISGFKISDIGESIKDKRVLIEYKLPEPIVVRTGNDYNISIDFRSNYPELEIVQKEVTISQKAYIKVETVSEKSWSDYIGVVTKIRNLLSLLVGEPSEILSVEGKTEANKETIEQTMHYPPVKIFSYVGRRPKSDRKLVTPEMLFTFRDIFNRFADILKVWFQKVELLEPVFNSYFGALYNPEMYLEQRFLSLVMALESYHRRVTDNRELSNEEHEKRMDAILSSAPGEHRKWLSKKLRYSNEPNLRRRLKEILDDCGELDTFVKDKKSFVDKVVETRNYNVHFDLNSKERASKGLELYRLTEKLQVLVEISLLRKLGFTIEEIKESFSRYRRYQEVDKWK